MLQQTQTDRVIPKYREFLQQFPTVHALAASSLGDVLRVWQGLGYNRRARALHACARVVVSEYRGVFPRTYEALIELPGIGPYTAGAILAFAFNTAVPIIETNIRTVYLHEFFNDKTDVHDRELAALIEETLDRENPRAWYAALMDYGAHLKKIHGNANVRSRHYTKQSKFEGSDRQIRGAIVRHLGQHASETLTMLTHAVSSEQERVRVQLEGLIKDGLVMRTGNRYMLAE